MIEGLHEMTAKLDSSSFTCFDLVKCMFHLNETEMAILRAMDATEALTAKQIAGLIKRDRATAYRALEKLVGSGMMLKERRGRETRGYSNYYRLIPRKELYRKAERDLDACYTRIKSTIERELNDQ